MSVDKDVMQVCGIETKNVIKCGQNNTPYTQIHDRSLSWLGTGSSYSHSYRQKSLKKSKHNLSLFLCY